PGTGFRAGAEALAAWLADPDDYRAARPVPPTLATATAATSTVAVPESGVPVAPLPATLPPVAGRAPFASGRPRHRAAWAGGVALGLVALVALAVAAVRSG